MNTQVQMKTPLGIIAEMASQYGMLAERFEAVLRATVFPAEASKEQFAAFLMVARKYGLDPLTKQIFAFPDQRRGGVIPIVGVDGFVAVANAHPQFDGMEFVDTLKDDQLVSVTCKVYRKDRSHATEVTEYMAECKRDIDTWRKWPRRMLRHKATAQAIRYAFGLSGIYDEDEGQRILEAKGEVIDETTGEITQKPSPVEAMKEQLRSRRKNGVGKPTPEPKTEEATVVENRPDPEPSEAAPIDAIEHALSNAASVEALNQIAHDINGRFVGAERERLRTAYRNRMAYFDAQQGKR
jgi:phage recombination protein Bet